MLNDDVLNSVHIIHSSSLSHAAALHWMEAKNSKATRTMRLLDGSEVLLCFPYQTLGSSQQDAVWPRQVQIPPERTGMKVRVVRKHRWSEHTEAPECFQSGHQVFACELRFMFGL